MKHTASLPMQVHLSTRVNGAEIHLAAVEVAVPLHVTDSDAGSIDLALDTEELAALIRRAATALDTSTREDNR